MNDNKALRREQYGEFRFLEIYEIDNTSHLYKSKNEYSIQLMDLEYSSCICMITLDDLVEIEKLYDEYHELLKKTYDKGIGL